MPILMALRGCRTVTQVACSLTSDTVEVLRSRRSNSKRFGRFMIGIAFHHPKNRAVGSWEARWATIFLIYRLARSKGPRKDHSKVRLPDHCKVRLPDHSKVRLPDRSKVRLPDHCKVRLPDHSKVRLPDHCKVRLPDQSIDCPFGRLPRMG